MKVFLERYGIHGAAAGIVALLGFIVGEFVGQKITFSRPVFLLLFCLLAYIFSILLYELRRAKSRAGFESPALISIVAQDPMIFVFKPSDWVSFGLAYTVFYLIDEIEYFVGSGPVTNVQSNGLIQLSVLSVNTGKRTEEILHKLLKGAAEERSRVILKPGMSING